MHNHNMSQHITETISIDKVLGRRFFPLARQCIALLRLER